MIHIIYIYTIIKHIRISPISQILGGEESLFLFWARQNPSLILGETESPMILGAAESLIYFGGGTILHLFWVRQNPSFILGAAESLIYFGGGRSPYRFWVRQNPSFILGAAKSLIYFGDGRIPHLFWMRQNPSFTSTIVHKEHLEILYYRLNICKGKTRNLSRA